MTAAVTATPSFGFSLKFEDFYKREGLERVDHAFRHHLAEADPELAKRLDLGRVAQHADYRDEADLLLALAPHLESFLSELFDIAGPLAALAAHQQELAPLHECKRLFVQKRAAKALSPAEAEALDANEIEAGMAALLGGKGWDELTFARAVMGWQADEQANAAAIATSARYAAWAIHSSAGKHRHHHGRLFKVPAKLDPRNRVPTVTVVEDGISKLTYTDDQLRRREGFGLTDQGTDLAGALDEIDTCILCHHQHKDSCSKGVMDKKSGGFALNAVGVTQTGCPLEERISEMHEAKAHGLAMSAMAVAIVDNPMMAATGHRICNDCMTGCIFAVANRPPVDIPQAESRILKDVLELPWGFEIYSLLSRWNPLNLRRPLPLPPSGKTVLVAGLGPAGFTLAHHLMNDGHAVVAVDGLKIEPLPLEISGVAEDGSRAPFRAIRDATDLKEDLDSRVMAGFGGVAEYGITVRWDKNFLKIVRLLLERRAEYQMVGGVRLGGTVTLEQAFEMGFDHVALCMGAGRPTVIDMPNNLAPGVRQASDFLMALQLTGAARKDSVANLQLRLPVVVIGGGLTAVDTCTEALAYYPVQVEKYLLRWETMAAERGEEAMRAGLTEEPLEVAQEFLAHGRAIREERAEAAREGREPNIVGLLQQWGGATLAYRRSMVESPAYRNHEEVAKAFEEGIRFAEKLTPLAVLTDRHGYARALKVRDGNGVELEMPARSILVAAGTVPNTVLAREDEGVAMHGRYFQAVNEAGEPVEPQRLSKPDETQVLMSFHGESSVSFFGDLHPSFAGNVVTAMASAKKGYGAISRVLSRAEPRADATRLFAQVNEEWRARVESVKRLTGTIYEVVVKAPAAARAFLPGQFYRLQNFETHSPRTADTIMVMEGLALTGAWVDREAGLVSVIALEMGGSSDLCALLKPGEPVVLMGPTGAPTETPSGETVLLAGGGLGNAVLFSIGQALRRAGSRVLYFAGYRSPADRYKTDEIEAAADLVVWSVDKGEPVGPGRPGDRTTTGTIIESMLAYAEGRLGEQTIPLKEVDRIIAIGSDRMMRAVAESRHTLFAEYLKPGHEAIGSINAPMQCMMKEICAQCLQRLRDPVTGKEVVVFTCAGQDLPLDQVDFHGLNERLRQNVAQETLTKRWIDRGLKELGLR